MTTPDKPPRYHSFLLTTWEERGRDDDVPMAWRFGLEDVHSSGRRRVFATFEEMVLFLKEEIETRYQA